MTTRRQPVRRPVTTKAPAKAADNGVFDLNKVADEQRREPFRFKLGSHTFSLCHFADLDPRVLARYGKVFAGLDGDQTGDLELLPMMMDIFRSGLGADYDAFLAEPMTIAQLDALFKAWQSHGGMEPGESGASSDS